MKRACFFVFPILLVTCMAVIIQQHLMLSPDVAYLMYAAGQMLEGGKYISDIFETNPPMILYLYFPAYWMAKLPYLDSILAMRIYIFILSIVSCVVCFA